MLYPLDTERPARNSPDDGYARAVPLTIAVVFVLLLGILVATGVAPDVPETAAQAIPTQL